MVKRLLLYHYLQLLQKFYRIKRVLLGSESKNICNLNVFIGFI